MDIAVGLLRACEQVDALLTALTTGQMAGNGTSESEYGDRGFQGGGGSPNLAHGSR